MASSLKISAPVTTSCTSNSALLLYLCALQITILLLLLNVLSLHDVPFLRSLKKGWGPVDIFSTGWWQEWHPASKSLHQLTPHGMYFPSHSSSFTAVPSPVWEGGKEDVRRGRVNGKLVNPGSLLNRCVYVDIYFRRCIVVNLHSVFVCCCTGWYDRCRLQT